MSSATQQHSRKHAKRACRQKVRAGGDRVTWVRPLRRLHRAIERSLKLMDSTCRVVADSEEQGGIRPVRTSRRLVRASNWLFSASYQLLLAAFSLEEAIERAAAESASVEGVPELLDWAAASRELAHARLMATSEQLSGLHRGLQEGLRSGQLVPEPIEPRAERRPRIIVRTPPLLIAARAFLLHRRSSARDRIASVPVRRRRQALIVVTDAPRQVCRGRAPPSPDCRF
jgi:hypothetical protein